jgi:lysophospholipase L1-like esterase
MHSRHPLPAGVATSLFLETSAFFGEVQPEFLQGGRFASRVWRVLFNQDAQIVFHNVEAYGHELRPPAAGETPARRWLAYGSSITFGANALHPTNAYVQHAARRLGLDPINKGIPGSCLCEPAMTEWLATRVEWDCALLELGVNLTGLARPWEFEERAGALVRTLHQAHPDRRIVVLDILPNRGDLPANPESAIAGVNETFREILARIVAEIAHPNVVHVSARELLASRGGLHCDLLHPSDEGHVDIGEALAARIAGP